MAPSRIQLPGACCPVPRGTRTIQSLARATALAAMLLATDPCRASGAFSVNLAVVSDYVFRGLTQSWGQPALQGGGAFDHRGFDAGIWLSSVSTRSYPGGGREIDVFASEGRRYRSGLHWRTGVYGYFYPGANLDRAQLPPQSLNTLEANAAIGWRWLTLQYNRALTNYFGAGPAAGFRGSSRGSSYWQLDAQFRPAPNWTLGLHAGRTHYTTELAAPLPDGARNPSYSDYGVTLTRQLDTHWSLGTSLTHATNAAWYRDTASYLDANDTLNVGGTRVAIMLQGTL